MRIGLDARFLTHPQLGGFKTYSENLIASLARLDTENEYVLYLDRPPSAECKLPVGSNFVGRVVPDFLPIIGMPWREQVGLASRAAKDRLDLFHSPCLTAPLGLACPLVVTIHDMIWAFPERFSQKGARSVQRKLMEWYYRLVPRYACARASAIVTVSRSAKETIVERLGLRADRIFITYPAASSCFQVVGDVERIQSMRHKYGLHTRYILAIGSADPRKNIGSLVQAYSLLPPELKEGYELVIVWTHSFLAGQLLAKIEELELVKHIRFLRQVPTDDLVLLYNAASLFVFPSLSEGFGLPLLEAMSCGTPVISASNSSIPEIAGEAALLIEAQDTQAMANTMRHVLSDDTLRAAMIAKGFSRAGTFSWNRCALETIDVYKQILFSGQLARTSDEQTSI